MSLNANFSNSNHILNNNNNNNTTSGDNSSDSASNVNTEKKLEIVEKKLKKCSEKIESLKKKAQNEWSNQMNQHLKQFYNDNKNKSDADLLNSKSQKNQSEIDKEIQLLTKKMHIYEKRKQEYLFELNKETNTNPNSLLVEESDINTDSLQITSSIVNNSNETNPTTTSNKSGSNSNLNLPNGAITTVPSSLNFNNQITTTNNNNTSNTLPVKSSFIPAHRTQSFVNPLKQNDDFKQTNSTDDKMFYITNQDNSNFNSTMGDLNHGETNHRHTNEDLTQMSNKIDHLGTHQAENFSYLVEQNEKLSSYLDDLQKKYDEQTKLVKEIQQELAKNTVQLDRIQPCLYLMDKIEKKLDDLKSSSSQSLQSLQYNFTHFQRDVKEIKEDVSFMKNKVEMVEKNQKNYTESQPTNYYQLFYKLLDIILTVATIILLAISNLIASIKFVFLLYPRTILISLFLYFLFFYLVDHNKLLLMFTESNVFNHFDHHHHNPNQLNHINSNDLNNDDFNSIHKSNLTYFGKLIRSIYKLIFNLKHSSTTSS